MGVLADHQIKSCLKDGSLVIDPHVFESPKGCISYGVSSYGWDVRVGYKFKVFSPVHCGIIDPKKFDEKCFVDVDLTPREDDKWLVRDEKGRPIPHPEDHILIPPNSFALAETLEYLEIPRDVVCICLGKSTYARCGIIVNITPLEPEWTGKITMEISNTAPLPAKVYVGEGIAQILFVKGDSICQTSYADKKGVYQNQSGLTLPRIK